MEETKKLQVLPSEEDAVTKVWQDFGWKLFSSQEINNTDSHLERRGDTIYNVTTTENYINLLFKRDTNMANYNSIKALEDQYCSIPDNSGSYSSALKKFLIIAAVVLVALGALVVGTSSVGFGIFLFVLAAGAIVGAVFKEKSDSKLNAYIASENRKKDDQRLALRQQAKALIV